jgi:hypothetical protein
VFGVSRLKKTNSGKGLRSEKRSGRSRSLTREQPCASLLILCLAYCAHLIVASLVGHSGLGDLDANPAPLPDLLGSSQRLRSGPFKFKCRVPNPPTAQKQQRGAYGIFMAKYKPVTPISTTEHGVSSNGEGNGALSLRRRAGIADGKWVPYHALLAPN